MVLLKFHLLLTSTLALSLVAFATPSKPFPAHAASVINDKPRLTYDELYGLLTNFWDNFLSPADAIQAKAINSSIFAENVQGRLDATRTFEGRELNTEYLFGLFANLAKTPSSVSLLGVPLSYKIMKFTANDYISSASTQIMFNLTSLNLTVPIVIDTWASWNSVGQLTQYDAVFKWWQWLLDYVIESAMPILNVKTPADVYKILTPVLAQEMCSTAQTYCNGTNTQYSNMSSCVQYLTEEVRFGEAYEFGRNTLVCRTVHQNMVPFRPSVHCPHIGPTGGGYCTDDMTYLSTEEEKYYNISWMPKDHIGSIGGPFNGSVGGLFK